MKLVIAAILAASMLGGCASLLTANGSAAARWAKLERERAYKANPAVAQDKICKTIRVMGSNFPQKICSTQEEWNAFDQEQLARVEEQKRQNSQGGGLSQQGEIGVGQ